MATPKALFLDAVERHSPGGLKASFDAGLDPREPIEGKPLPTWLTAMYTRSDRFSDCLRLLLDRGAMLEDPLIAPVLLNDIAAIESAVRATPSLLAHRTTMVSAFTPLAGASLLHVAAEFGHLSAARTLIELGADVHARALADGDGLNGHTPIFHTVNSNENRSEPIMRLLLENGARTDLLLPGITWGRGFDWETTLFDVTPVSYALFGLLPQMHRDEVAIHGNVRKLIEASGRGVPRQDNIPNRYLHPTPK